MNIHHIACAFKENAMNGLRPLLVSVFVVGITACATTSGPPPSVDVTGRWAGTWAYDNPSLGNGQIEMNLKQTAANVDGNLNISGTRDPRSGPISAIVQGNQVVITRPTDVTGRLTVEGYTMSGALAGLSSGKMTVKRMK